MVNMTFVERKVEVTEYYGSATSVSHVGHAQ
jgi:hypothetical protein